MCLSLQRVLSERNTDPYLAKHSSTFWSSPIYNETLWNVFMFKAFVEQAEIKHVFSRSVELGPVLGFHKAICKAQSCPAQPPSWL